MSQSKTTPKDQPVSIVVGGMHGSGKNISRNFHRAGHNVLILDKQEVPNTENDPFYHSCFSVDLTQSDSVSKVIQDVKNAVPHVSNLIFSSRYRGGNEDAWNKEYSLGVVSPKKIIEGLTPLMEGNNASVVLISSVAARLFVPDCSPAYHSTKAAIEHMTRSYAVILGPKQIRVNAVAPGFIVKDESLQHILSDPERVKKIETLHPVRRIGRAEDVANAVLFLCNTQASFITGQVLTIDGGLSLLHYGYHEGGI